MGTFLPLLSRERLSLFPSTDSPGPGVTGEVTSLRPIDKYEPSYDADAAAWPWRSVGVRYRTDYGHCELSVKRRGGRAVAPSNWHWSCKPRRPGPTTSHWLGAPIRDRREAVTLATKFGNVRRTECLGIDRATRPCGRRATRPSAGWALVTSSICIISTASIPAHPIEETVDAMADLGPSTAASTWVCGSHRLRRAHAVHPIAALPRRPGCLVAGTRGGASRYLP